MKIADVLNVTGGNTKVVYGIDNNKYIVLWKGIIDDIDFSMIPYGQYEVQHITVINDEDVLQLHVECPKLTEKEKENIGKEATGYPYPTDWIEQLYIKFGDFEKIREIFSTKTNDEIYEYIKTVSNDIVTDDEVEKEDRITISRWSSGLQGHGIDIMIESSSENRVIYKGSMELEEFAKCITAQASCKIVTEIE